MASTVITVYRNGDNHFSGKKLVVNRKQIRNFDNFLDRVTRDTQAGCAIRSIRTPNHGSKILSLEKLENGGIYVAVGLEKFKQLRYAEIQDTRHHYLHKSSRKELSPIKNRINASARYSKVANAEPLRNRIIYVFRNGEHREAPIKLLLDKWLLQSMDNVLQHITYKVKLRTGAVRSMYTVDGVAVKDTGDIETGQVYIAVGYGKPFIKAAYTQLGLFSVTPRKTNQSSHSGSTFNSSAKHDFSKRKLKPLKRQSTLKKDDLGKSQNKETSQKPERHWKKHLHKGKIEKEVSSGDQSTSTKNQTNYKNSQSYSDIVNDISENLYNSSMEDGPSLEKVVHLENNLATFNEESDNENNDQNNNTIHLERERTFEKDIKEKTVVSLVKELLLDEDRPKTEIFDDILENNRYSLVERFSGSIKDQDRDEPVISKKSRKIVGRKNNKSKKSFAAVNKIESRNSVHKEASIVDSLEPVNTGSSSFNANYNGEGSYQKTFEENLQEIQENEYNKSIDIHDDHLPEIEKEAEDDRFEEIMERSPRKKKKEEEIDTADLQEENGIPESSLANDNIFNATGKQKEVAKAVKDNNETNVEKTLDMVDAEEVDDEDIQGEDSNEELNAVVMKQ